MLKNVILPWQVLLLSVLACSSERATRPGPDASTPDADGGGTPAFGACAPLGSCPAHSIGVWQELLKASDFGSDARLLAMGGQGVLIALGDGRFRVARLPEPGSTLGSTGWDVPNASPRAVPLGVVVADAPQLLSVLTCGADGSHCSVWQADIQSDALSSWREQALPPSFRARGIAQDRSVDGRPSCVYGSGMYCWAQTWQSVIAEASELQLNAVAFGATWSVAVGEHGRWWKRERGADWVEQAALSDQALDRVAVTDDAGAVILGGGKLRAALGSQSAVYACLVGADVSAFTLDAAAPGLAYAVTANGLIVQHSANAYCQYQQLGLSGSVIQSGTSRCGASLNPRILTATELFGQNDCLEVP